MLRGYLPDQNHRRKTRTLGVWPGQTAPTAGGESDWWTASKAQTGPETHRLCCFHIGANGNASQGKAAWHLVIPPWGRQSLLPGTWRPRTDRRGDGRCLAPSSPGGTCFGAFLLPFSATSDVLPSDWRREKQRKHDEEFQSVIYTLDWGVQPYCFISDHGANKGTGLHGAGAHGFSPALTK